MATELVDLREPKVGLVRLVPGLASLSVVAASSFRLPASLVAGDACIVLNLFLSANVEVDFAVFVAVRVRIVEFVGAVFELTPSLVAVGLRTVGRLGTGLAAPLVRVEIDVAVEVRRIGAGAFLEEGVVVVVVVEGVMDMRFGLAVSPSRFDSSSVVLPSTEVSEGLTR